MIVRAVFALVVLAGSLPAKAQDQASAPRQEIQAVDFCNLVRHPEQYDDKAVKVTATYYSDLEGAILFDDACKQLQPNEQVTANAKFAKGKDGTAAFEKLRKFLRTDRPRFANHYAEVTVVATFRYPLLSGKIEMCAGCSSYTLEISQVVALERLKSPSVKNPHN